MWIKNKLNGDLIDLDKVIAVEALNNRINFYARDSNYYWEYKGEKERNDAIVHIQNLCKATCIDPSNPPIVLE